MTEGEARFLEKRVRLVNAWRPVGAGLLITLTGLGGWLLWFAPLLANPYAVLNRLRDDAIPLSSMALATALLPIMSLVCLLLAFAIVLFVFVAIANERRYLSILRRIDDQDA